MSKVFSFLITLSILYSNWASAQEFRCQVKVLDNKIQNVDPKVFRTMEKQLTQFLNDQIWTKVRFEEEEKINLSFIITPEKSEGDQGSIFSGNIAILANRPVYMTEYATTIFNYLDRNFQFKYLEQQNLQFNEMQLNRGDPLADNLVAVLGYYSYIVLGLYFDSFKENGGDKYFQQARNIVTNAPSGGGIVGWTASGTQKNSRYWLIDDLQSPRMTSFHTLWYQYHRAMLDYMYNPDFPYSDELETIINEFSKLYTQNASSNLVEFFITTKGNEIFDMINNSTSESKKSMAGQMAQMHVVRFKDYQKIMNGA